MDTDVLKEYIRRVSSLRDESLARFDEESLRQIALEVGVSEEELALAAKEARDHQIRGQQHLRHGHVEDAIRELTESLGLAPGNDEVRMELAGAYLKSFEAGGGAVHGDHAERLVRECLKRRPSLDRGYELLSQIEEVRRERGMLAASSSAMTRQAATPGKGSATRRGRKVMVGAVAALILLVGVAGILTTRSDVEGEPVLSRDLAQPPAQPPGGEEVREFSTVAPAPDWEGFSVVLLGDDADEGLELRTYNAEHKVYTSSAFLEWIGWVNNHSESEYSTIRAELRIYDHGGDLLGEPATIRILENHHVPLRPEDSQPLRMLQETTDQAVRAELKIVNAEKVPAAGNYEASRPLELFYGEGVAPRESLVLRERYSGLSPNSLGGSAFLRGHFEFINMGPAIRTLKVRLDALDGDEEVLQSLERIVASDSVTPPILSKEQRLYGTMTQVPLETKSHRLTVIELR